LETKLNDLKQKQNIFEVKIYMTKSFTA